MQVDYLIVGAGATGMAFLDVILQETDATVAIVDRRDAPGGHWNDAYPFVRLHQSSSFYGVPSRSLGQDRVTRDGYNAGLFELASKYEILDYYRDLMENEYLPSGRVRYFPMSEYDGAGQIRSLVSGKPTQVEISKKLVNAGIWGDLASIPLTHERSFDVAEGVECIAPNYLPRRAPDHDRFTVIGAGKTAMDAVLWLLDKGTDPENIDWVRPNEYWLFKRDNILPHKDFFFLTMATNQSEIASLGTSASVREHCENMEKNGSWHRIDQTLWPEKFHAAVCSAAEVDALRSIKNVIRAGHVTRIEADRLVLQDAEVPVRERRLYIDCTARGGVILDAKSRRVFETDTINLFMIRPFQPVFSAALVAHIEACIEDDAVRQRCTGIVNFNDTPAQYIRVQLQGFLNQAVWNKIPEIKSWIDTCRLNSASHLLNGLTPQDHDKLEVLGRYGPLVADAVENIPRLLASEAR